MDRYAVLGNPVAHSRSPFIHAQFAARPAQAIAYDRLLCPLDGFAAAVRRLRRRRRRGCNVTVPFKFDACTAGARGRSARAALAGRPTCCASTPRRLVRRQHRRHRPGARHQHNAGVALGGTRVLLIGAGGAAAGVLGPLLEPAARELVVANRTPTKARRWSTRTPRWPSRTVRAAAPRRSTMRRALRHRDQRQRQQPARRRAAGARPACCAPGALALDMMYGPAARAFLAWARAHGARGRDGLGMLVEQAAEAFFFWRGVRPDTAPVLASAARRIDA